MNKELFGHSLTNKIQKTKNKRQNKIKAQMTNIKININSFS